MIIFVIPAYNEAENINTLFLNLDFKMRQLKLDYRVILVNDGSTDSTKEDALSFKNRMPIEILDHATNRGVGEVFKTGFARALAVARDSDIIVTKEADNTSDLNILNEMLKKIKEGDDLILASCYARGGSILGTTVDRVILSFCANFLLKLIFSLKEIHTYSSFYRMYRVGMLKQASFAYDNNLIENKGFTCMVEMLIKLSRLPIRISEVPMVLRCNFRKGVSKMNKISTIRGYLRLITKQIFFRKKRMQAILSKYHSYVKTF